EADAEIGAVHWPANRKAEIVITERRALGLAVRLAAEGRRGRGVGEKVVGVEPLVANELEGRAVESIRAAARDDVDLAAAAAARFGRVEAAQHFEFANR